MATRAGVTPAPPGRRAVASAQQSITGFFQKATAAEAAEQAAARMEAIAATTAMTSTINFYKMPFYMNFEISDVLERGRGIAAPTPCRRV